MQQLVSSKPLLDVLRRQASPVPCQRIPIWFMRQAGRYLPEYLAVRRHFPDFVAMCLDPEASVTVALQPLERFDLDAAIVFSDIMIILHALGIAVSFVEGYGPVVGRLGHDYSAQEFCTFHLSSNIMEAVQKGVKGLRTVMNAAYPYHTLIGFAGAPWTLFCYMVEGSGKESRDFALARAFAYERREESEMVMDHLVAMTTEYLCAQITAGAEVVHLFDSWAGVLPAQLHRSLVIEPTRRLIQGVRARHPEVPVVAFPKGIGANLSSYMKMTQADGVAIDGAVVLESIPGHLIGRTAIQGNVDNVLMTADPSSGDVVIKIIATAYHLLRTIANPQPGRLIVNTSHGLLPNTRIENVRLLIDTVRAYESST